MRGQDGSEPKYLTQVYFMMMRQIGGNPFRQSERAVPEAVQRNLERKFNVDKPWYLQYAYYVKGVATFDLGDRTGGAVLLWITDLGEGNSVVSIGELNLS